MKIGIVFTGGTIASKAKDDGYLSPYGNRPFSIFEKHEEKYGSELTDDVEFIVKEPFTILSENLTADNICKIVDCVDELLKEDVYGIIVTHGTDTLQYTAAVLGFVFEDADVPIVLVSSNKILEDESANGTDNLHLALLEIRGRKSGVYVSYRNDDEEPKLHKATKLLDYEPYSDRLKSLDENDHENKDDEEKINAGRFAGLIGNKLCERGCIIRIKQCPGMIYPDISKASVIILESYHSGTLCMDEEFLTFMKEANERNIYVCLCGLDKSEAASYETMKNYDDLNIHVAGKIPPIALYCKLWIAISLSINPDEVIAE